MRWKIIISMGLIIAILLFAMPSNSESISRTVHFSPQSTNNNTSIPSIETQMNTFVFGLGAGLGNLATFAYQNSTRANPSTMLQDMEIFVYSLERSHVLGVLILLWFLLFHLYHIQKIMQFASSPDPCFSCEF